MGKKEASCQGSQIATVPVQSPSVVCNNWPLSSPVPHSPLVLGAWLVCTVLCEDVKALYQLQETELCRH